MIMIINWIGCNARKKAKATQSNEGKDKGKRTRARVREQYNSRQRNIREPGRQDVHKKTQEPKKGRKKVVWM
jgi:hypothetical protein